MRFVPPSMIQLLIGGFLAAVAALASWRLRWLSGSGAWAAFILGLVVFGLGGLDWAIVLLAFFVSSTILSLLFKARKRGTEMEYQKGSRRDAGQVLANGMVAGVFVVVHVFFPDSRLPWTGFVAALAAATADTWATELGVFSRRPPVMITTAKPVERGTSGAISALGSSAAALGAALIAVTAWLVWPADTLPASAWWMLVIAVAGFYGSLTDSWLGATVQTIYFCPSCQKDTEQPVVHHCGSATVFKRGWRWMDNDWVNLVCTAAASLAAILCLLLPSI